METESGAAWEMVCDQHRGEFIGRVSSHESVPAAGESHASTYVCARPECVDAAERWVEEVCGLPGRFYPLRDDVEVSS